MCVTMGIISAAVGATGPLRLVLVHGRGQQRLDHDELKSNWLNTLRRGAQKLGRTLPDTIDVAFPYYGDALDRYIRNYNIPLTSDMQTRGSKVDDEFLVFQAECAEACRKGSCVMRKWMRNMVPTPIRKVRSIGNGCKRSCVRLTSTVGG